MKQIQLFWILVFIFWSAGNAGALQKLEGHRPEAVKRQNVQPVERLLASRRLQLAIGLPLRNQEALGAFLQQLYDPTSPQYHHYLTPEQFTEMFGPTEQDYQAVIAFAQSHGLTVTARHPNRVVLDVEGTVMDIEKAFHVAMQVYRHPKEARTFYAPDAEPSVDLAVPILHVSGLDNYSLPHPMYVAKPVPATHPMNVTANAGAGPRGTYMGNDFRAAYVPGTSLTGSGQTVGLLQFDGYTASDIAYYENQAGLSPIPLQNVLIDGATGNPTDGGEVEVCLDIEMVASMAPGVSQIIVYMAPNPSPWVDLLSRMANDNLAKQLSCSWTGGPPDPTSEQVFQQMAAQGQSFFTASGDSDAFTGSIDFPADSTNITVVGGTTLTTTGPGGSYVSETVWNWGNSGSSGGISTYYPIPAYQQGLSMVANHGSTTMRNVPDVALTADNVYVRADGADQNVGGTSCATPLWAGLMALINQQGASFGKPSVGFLNPVVYAIGTGTTYSSTFHDITTGNNFSSSSPSNFPAVAGYDLCTGWGTPNGTNLINALAFPSLTLSIPATATEGDGVLAGQGHVGIAHALTNNLSVALTSSSTNKVLVPPTVMIPAGATNVSFNITIVDNGLLDGTQYALVTAIASGYGSATASLAVYDNESAALTLSAPATVAKGQGVLTNAGAVFVSTRPASDVAVLLSSSDTGKIRLPSTVTIPAGQTSNAFNITVLDDHLASAPQAVTLTAHVQNWTDGTAAVTVFNNTNLMVNVPASVYKNAGMLLNGGSVTVDAAQPTDVQINLASSNTNKVIVPSSVTITAGTTSSVFNVWIVNNNIPDGTQIATVTATATGFASGSGSITVKDNLVYQFGISNVASPQSAGTPFSVSVAAMDINGSTITVYRMAITLSAAGDGGTDSVQPTSISSWTNGVWTGAVRVNTVDTNVRLTAKDGAGHSVRSNPFNVQIGPVDHLTWARVSSPQHQDAPFAVTVTAKDAANNTVTRFTGAVALGATCYTPGPNQLLTFDDLPGNGLPMPAGYGGLTWNNFDYLIGANYLNSGYSCGTVSLSNIVFNNFGAPASIISTAQMNFVSAYLTAAWYDNLQVEVKGYIGSTLAYDTTNMLSATAPTLINFNYRGVTEIDFRSYGGTQHSGYNGSGTQFLMDNVVIANFTSPVSISPTNSGSFVSGVWTGAVTALEAATNLYLRADDGASHSGTSTLFNVTATVDIAAAISAAPEPVQAGSNLTYRVTITNSGPDRAADVLLTDPLPSNVTLVSASVSQGSITQSASVLQCSLGSIDKGTTASATITVTPSVEASLTNTVTVSNSATDSNPANNTATVVSTVQGRGSLAVIPAMNLIFTGMSGASFSPGSQVYTLTNNGTARLNWQATNTATWVRLSAASGALSAHTATNVAVSINANANGLSTGTHTNTITFTNLSTGTGSTNCNVILNMVLPPSITNQPTSHTVMVGSNVTLNVGVTGTGPFQYQWQFNGTNLPNNIITTVAGMFAIGDGGSSTNAAIYGPSGVAVDTIGNLYIADYRNNRIRKVGTNGVITTLAGNGTPDYSGDYGVATNASLSYPHGVAVDASGNVFIADSNNNRIREVSTNGIITTVAGNGQSGYSGDGGAAKSAMLSYPDTVAVDARGNLFIADYNNNRIRKVSTAGTITTIAGNGTASFSGDGGVATNASLNSPHAVAVDASGNLFIADSNNNRIRKVGLNGVITTLVGDGMAGYIGDGGAATNASLFYPWGVAVDVHGNLFIGDCYNSRIRKVSSSAIITTVAGNGSPGFSGDGRAATNASLFYPEGVAIDTAGNVFIADSNNNRVRRVNTAGTITTVVGDGAPGYSGDGGAATSASLNGPRGVAVDAAGNLVIADSSNYRIREVNPAGIIATVAGNGWAGHSGDGGAATNASLYYPCGVTVDASGQIFIADAYNSRLRRASPNGLIATVAGNGTSSFAGDGAAATNASLSYPYGVAVDGIGRIFIADSNNNRVRIVTPNGLIATVAGNGTAAFAGDGGAAANCSLYYPNGVAVDAAGNAFIADCYNGRIRKISPAGLIATVAGIGFTGFSGDGGAATNAMLCWPSGVAVDAFGNVFIADSSSHRIREVNPAGMITTVAGNGTPGYSGDGGAATNASLYYPNGVAVDASGNLFIADTSNHRIREVGLAGNPALSLNGVTTNNAGSYSVIISSPYGSVTSSVVTVTVTLVDNVGDGIPNWWRAQYFGGSGMATNGQSCASCDPDGDGFTNAQEYDAGTNPTNAASRPFNHGPVIVSPPVVTNALLQVGTVAVVVQGETNTFMVDAVDADGDPLSYQWSFGDGSFSGTSPTNLATHAYNADDCGPYAAYVTVTDGQTSINSNLTVAVACQLNITRLRLKLNFARTNADSCTVKGVIEPPAANYTFSHKQATLDIGGAEVSFNLDGKGNGRAGSSTFKPSYSRSHTNWTFSATLRSGSWQTPWAEYGMIDSNVPKPGILVTNLPVIFILDTEAFVGTTNLYYTATHKKSGAAK